MPATALQVYLYVLFLADVLTIFKQMVPVLFSFLLRHKKAGIAFALRLSHCLRWKGFVLHGYIFECCWHNFITKVMAEQLLHIQGRRAVTVQGIITDEVRIPPPCFFAGCVFALRLQTGAHSRT